MQQPIKLGLASLIICSTMWSCSPKSADIADGNQAQAFSCSEVESSNWVNDRTQGSNRAQATNGTAAEINKWINDQMHDTYLWYQHTPDLDYESYTDPSQLLADLRYSKHDRFSYLMDEADYIASQQGRTTAFGFNFGIFDDLRLFRFIHPGSPMAEAGIKRGDQVLEIASIPVEQITSSQFNTLLDTQNGANTQSFKILHKDTGQTQTHEVTSGEFSIQTVFKQNCQTRNGVKSAYLGFSAFMRTSSDELTAAFENLKQENVEELVLDLRYNSGGLINVSAQLAGLIGGTNTYGEPYGTLKFNDRYSDNNYTYNYTLSDHALNLERVVVLTSSSTCSASEMLINGLKPFVEVITIGSTSCGKPIGMSPQTALGKTLFAINFESRNALDEGEFYNGFSPDCAVDDYPAGAMWDGDDSLYKSALYYLENGRCPTDNRTKRATQYTAITPKQMKVQDLPLF